MNTENMESTACPGCGAFNAPGADRCARCGETLLSAGDDNDREMVWAATPTRFRRRSLQLFTGLIFGAVMTYAIYFIAGLYPDSLIHRILAPGGFQQMLPVAIVALTFWPLGVVLIRLLFILRDRSGFNVEIAGNLAEILTEGGKWSAKDLAARVRVLKPAANPLLSARIAIVRKALARREPAMVLERRLATENDLDDAEMDGNYSLIHLFIWALPILGFLGTVIGITLAVADFSGFLGGNIDDIDLIKSQLGHVTNGLSFAFGTTILGLAGALVVMLLTSITQNVEMGFATRIRRFCVEHLLPLAASEQPGDTE